MSFGEWDRFKREEPESPEDEEGWTTAGDMLMEE